MSLPLAQTLASCRCPKPSSGFMTWFSLTVSDHILMIAILMIAGCVMETTPNIVILAPLLLPLAQEIGMHVSIFAFLWSPHWVSGSSPRRSV